MVVDPKQALHDLVDRLRDDEVQRLTALLRDGTWAPLARHPRPLSGADIVLRAPIMPAEETADDLIAAVRQWRHEGGSA